MNYLSDKTGLFDYTSYAYGLNYSSSDPDEYSIQRIKYNGGSDSLISNSYHDYIGTLTNWKSQTKPIWAMM